MAAAARRARPAAGRLPDRPDLGPHAGPAGHVAPRSAGAIASADVADQVQRQIATLDQRLQVLAQAWETDPAHFNLQSWRQALIAPAGIVPDLLLVDPQGVVRQSTIPGDTGLLVRDQDYFRAALEHATNQRQRLCQFGPRRCLAAPVAHPDRALAARSGRLLCRGHRRRRAAPRHRDAVPVRPRPPPAETAAPLLSWRDRGEAVCRQSSPA